MLLWIIFITAYPPLSGCVLTDNPDCLEYQTQGVNFARHNQPVTMGYLDDPSNYDICSGKSTITDSLVVPIFMEVTPVPNFSKPPLLPLTIGLTYKIFGIQALNYQRMQVFMLLLLAVLLPITGFSLFSWPGYLSGWLAGTLICLIKFHEVNEVDAEILANSLFFLAFNAVIFASRSTRKRYHLFLGIAFGAMCLTKGNLLFIVLFYCAIIGLRNLLKGRFPLDSRLILIIAGFLFTLAPWTISVNIINQRSADQREVIQKQNASKIDSDYQVTIDRALELFEKDPLDPELRQLLVVLIRSYYHYNLEYSKFIILTDQFYPDALLMSHNEFVHMGFWIQLYPFLKGTYHAEHLPTASPLTKVFLFYMNNPKMMVLGPLGKINYSAGQSTPFFWGNIVFMCLFFLFRIEPIKRNLPIKTALFAIGFICFVLVALKISGFILMGFLVILAMTTFVLLILSRPDGIHCFMMALVLGILFTINLAFGHRKFVNVVDSVTALTLFYYFYKTVKELIPRKMSRIKGDYEVALPASER